MNVNPWQSAAVKDLALSVWWPLSDLWRIEKSFFIKYVYIKSSANKTPLELHSIKLNRSISYLSSWVLTEGITVTDHLKQGFL